MKEKIKGKIRDFLLTIFELIFLSDLSDSFFGCCYIVLLVLVILALRWGN